MDGLRIGGHRGFALCAGAQARPVSVKGLPRALEERGPDPNEFRATRSRRMRHVCTIVHNAMLLAVWYNRGRDQSSRQQDVTNGGVAESGDTALGLEDLGHSFFNIMMMRSS